MIWDRDFYLFCLKEYELIRQRRKSFKGKPNAYDRLDIELDRMFEEYYKRVIK